MNLKSPNRQFLSLLIIVFYLIPLFFFSSYSIGLMSHQKSWALLSLGLLVIACGSLTLILLLHYWEETIRMKPRLDQIEMDNPSIFSTEEKVTYLDPSLNFNLNAKNEFSGLSGINLHHPIEENELREVVLALQIKNQEWLDQQEQNRLLEEKVLEVGQDFADYKLFSEEQLKQKQLQLTSLQQIVEDQRSEMEKRQEQIYQLDTKVHDLSYEIKTLLYLNQEETVSYKNSPIKVQETPVSYYTEHSSVKNDHSNNENYFENQASIENTINIPSEAILLLKKCINNAQKLTGANYYSNELTRYREFSSSYFAIDQRRLFDSLRVESGAIIIVYSQKELKVLFVNNQSNTILGWSPEKFVADFNSIMQEGLNDWKKALSQLAVSHESHTHLLAKTKQGNEILLNCHFGVIPTGLFRNYVIGVLYHPLVKFSHL